jgi:tetratricopeptide (TPR) repeat protein
LKFKTQLFRDRTFWIGCGVVAATIAAYWPVGSADFVAFDDLGYVYQNPHVRQGLSWESVQWALTSGRQSNWHPLTWWSLMLDVQLFGVSSRAMHLVNLGLHLGSSIVLLLALRRLTGAVWRSGMVAALFALHPLHVESVAWVAERKDVLSTFLGMLALWAYAGYAQRPLWRRYILVFVLLGLGLMAKPMLVTLPLVFLLLDYWPLGRFQAAAEAWKAARQSAPAASARPNRGRARWKRIRAKALRWSALSGLLRPVMEKLPLLALAAVSCRITYLMAQSGGAMAPMQRLPLAERVANAGSACVSYLVKMLCPTNLSVYYPLPERPALVLGFAAWVLLAGLSVAAAVAARRGRKYLAVGWLWYLGTLVPAIGLVQVGEQSMADRYTYIPLIGLFLAATWGAADLTAPWRHQRLVLGAAAGGMLLACGLLTAGQVRVWANSETLFQQAIRVQPDNWHAHRLLAAWLWQEGRYEEAMERWQTSLRFHADDADVAFDMGVAAAGHGEKERAMASFREVLRLRPERADARELLTALAYDVGVAAAKRGEREKAMACFREVLSLQPDREDVRQRLAGLAMERAAVAEKRGEKQKAVASLYEALSLRGDQVEVRVVLAGLLTEMGAIGPALEQWKAVLDKAPQHVWAANTLAWIFATCPDPRFRNGELAVKFALEAVQLTQDRSAAKLATLDTLAAAYAEAGQFDKAVATVQQALGLPALRSDKPLAAAMQARLKSYQARKPWRDPQLAPAPKR